MVRNRHIDMRTDNYRKINTLISYLQKRNYHIKPNSKKIPNIFTGNGREIPWIDCYRRWWSATKNEISVDNVPNAATSVEKRPRQEKATQLLADNGHILLCNFGNDRYDCVEERVRLICSLDFFHSLVNAIEPWVHGINVQRVVDSPFRGSSGGVDAYTV